jgi:hypothetical protein
MVKLGPWGGAASFEKKRGAVRGGAVEPEAERPSPVTADVMSRV